MFWKRFSRVDNIPHNCHANTLTHGPARPEAKIQRSDFWCAMAWWIWALPYRYSAYFETQLWHKAWPIAGSRMDAARNDTWGVVVNAGRCANHATQKVFAQIILISSICLGSWWPWGIAIADCYSHRGGSVCSGSNHPLLFSRMFHPANKKECRQNRRITNPTPLPALSRAADNMIRGPPKHSQTQPSACSNHGGPLLKRIYKELNSSQI